MSNRVGACVGDLECGLKRSYYVRVLCFSSCNNQSLNLSSYMYTTFHTNFLLSFGLVQNEHDKIKELSQQLAVEKKRAASYKRQLELVFEHIEEHNKNLSNNIQDIVNSVKEMESKEHWNGTQLETSRGKRKPS